jgi:hypothetical protein
MSSYHRRKAEMLIRRAKHAKTMNTAEHLATLFRGVGVGFSFIAIMSFVAGIHTTLEIVLFLGFIIIAGAGFNLAEAVLFIAQERKYPKSRRIRLRDLFTLQS